MTSILLAGPAVEPVSLGEAKTFLRVDTTDEDDLIQTLIAAGRVHVEAITRRAMIEQNWRLSFDEWPDGNEVRVPLGPLAALAAVRVYDPDDAATALALTQFLADIGSTPGRIVLPPTIEGEPVKRDALAIEIDYTAGYGAAATDVPEALRQAMLVLVAHWFEHRDAVLMAGTGAIVPVGFDKLIAPYRVVSL